MIIDTHCHLIDEAFVQDCDAVVARAVEADVRKMILACCDETEVLPIRQLCCRYPGVLYPTLGIHPENMAQDLEKQTVGMKQLLDEAMQLTPEAGRPIAIGEVGIDLHWDTTRLHDQEALLTEQTQWALEYDLPLLLHIRDAMPEFLHLLEHTLYNYAREKGRRLRGVLHCYSGDSEQFREALQWGDWMIGIGGTSTYKKSLVPDVARAIGLDHILLETDAPYLAPMPHRGKRNEPAYTALTCQALAQLFGTDAREVAERTTRNAEKLFGEIQ